MEQRQVELSCLLGRIFLSVTREDDSILFKVSEIEAYRLVHVNECCESVYISEVAGDLKDLAGSPILFSTETSQRGELPKPLKTYNEYYTWSFYKFATVKGWVDVRFNGESNGCYSERAELYLESK